MDGLHYRDL